MTQDFFEARDTFETSRGRYTFYRLSALETAGVTRLERLPFSIRILLESVLRQCNDREITRQDVINLAGWQAHAARPSLPLPPGAW